MKGTIQVSRLGSASEHMQQEEGEVPESTHSFVIAVILFRLRTPPGCPKPPPSTE
jgi:hypothetical protein